MSTQPHAFVTWDEAADIFEWDGSWRDLYAFETTAEHWDLLLRALKAAPLEVAFTRGDEPSPLPDNFEQDLGRDPESRAVLVSVVIDKVRLSAHPFTADEIEFDIDPREITGAEEFGAVVRFMNFFADAVNKPVVLTPENGPYCPLLVARPGIAGVVRGEPVERLGRK